MKSRLLLCRLTGRAVSGCNRFWPRVCTSLNYASTSRVTDEVEAKPKQLWDIFAAVALSRHPVIAPPMSDVERRFADVQRRIEVGCSLKSDFEIRDEKDKALLAKRTKLEAEGKDLSELDEQLGVTAEVQKDEWERKGDAILKRFAIGDVSKVQEDSEMSIRRKLDEQLVFIVRQKFHRKDGYKSPWILPQLKHHGDETLKQTVERCLGEVVEGDLQATILSNAPFSVYSHHYPSGLKLLGEQGAVGAKIFFYNVWLTQGSTFSVCKNEIAEYKWVTAEEFSKTVKSRRYRNALSTLFH